MHPSASRLPVQPFAVSAAHPVLRVAAGAVHATSDLIVEEVPVALVYNGVSHAVMMATPADLEDFALGFSLSEGILDQPGQCYGIEVRERADGIELAIDVASAAFVRLKERRRSLAGRTGCGLCGIDSLQQLKRSFAPVRRAQPLQPASVLRALDALRGQQALAQLTGASHAAAWCDHDGACVLVREDVGRHNALDKIIGAMAHAAMAPDAGFLLLTSRVSLEMVQKSAAAGIGAVVGISAPTLAAVRLAEEVGLTMLAFARANSFVCYTHPEGCALDHSPINKDFPCSAPS